MSSRAARNSAAASDWAARRKEAIERAARLKEERKNKAAHADTPEPAPLPPRQTDNYSHVRSTGYGGAAAAAGSGGRSPAPAPQSFGYGEGYGGYAPPPQPPSEQYSARGYSGDQGGYHNSSSYHIPSHETHYGSDYGRPEYGYQPAAAPSTYYRSGSREGVGSAVAYGRRSSPDHDAEHVLDAMPALDLKPMRVRRPGSSSKMHTQGQLKEPLLTDDDWSSPEKGRTVASPALHQQHGRGYGNYANKHYPQQPYSSTSYQQEPFPGRGDSGRHPPTGNASRSSAGARRPKKPDWNSDFVEERPLEAAADSLLDVPKAPARAGRRASSGSAQARPVARPDWNTDFAEPLASEGQPDIADGRRSTSAPISANGDVGGYMASVQQRVGSREGGGSARGVAGKGLEKLKKMSLRRVGSGGASRSGDAGSAGGAGMFNGVCKTAQASQPDRIGGGAGMVAGSQSEQPSEYADAPVRLLPCEGCGRSFNEKALARHAKICAKVFQEKRKPMDISQQRVGGTEAAKHFQGGPAEVKPSPIKQAAMERQQAGGRAPPSASRPVQQRRQPAYSASRYRDEEDAASEPGGRGGMARPTGSGRGGRQPDWDQTGGSGAMDGVPEYAPQDNLRECGGCGRRFNDNAYAKHAKVCAKVFQAKRKPMDMTKQRVAGTEAAKYAGKAGGVKKQGTVSGGARGGRHEEQVIRTRENSKAKWKQQSEGLRAAMAANRKVAAVVKAGGNLADLPNVPSAPDPSFVPCPHCGRSFNEKAAERHIPQCKNIIAKPKFLKRNAGYGAHNRAAAARR